MKKETIETCASLVIFIGIIIAISSLVYLSLDSIKPLKYTPDPCDVYFAKHTSPPEPEMVGMSTDGKCYAMSASDYENNLKSIGFKDVTSTSTEPQFKIGTGYTNPMLCYDMDKNYHGHIVKCKDDEVQHPS